MEQLDDNIGALDVKLPPERIAELDKTSAPALPFPVDVVLTASCLAGAPDVGHAD